MVVSFGDGVNFVIILHQVWKKHPLHQDFLGFYVVDSHRMSAQTHGLLGMQYSNCTLLSHMEALEINVQSYIVTLYPVHNTPIQPLHQS